MHIAGCVDVCSCLAGHLIGLTNARFTMFRSSGLVAGGCGSCTISNLHSTASSRRQSGAQEQRNRPQMLALTLAEHPACLYSLL